MLKLEQTKAFKKCLKKYKGQKKALDELKKIIHMLVHSETIPAKYRDHKLKGKYHHLRELHVQPDTLLLYIKCHHEKITLVALGSHSDIF